MGVSKNRKKHASKVAQYKQKVRGEKKRAQEAMMKMYQEMQSSKLRQHTSGVDVENTDIDVDVDLEDLSVDAGIDVENFQVTEEVATEIVTEIIEEITEEK